VDRSTFFKVLSAKRGGLAALTCLCRRMRIFG
jgi:hypothetical protein